MSLRTLRHWSLLIGVNIAIAVTLLAACEMAARHFEPRLKHGVELTVQFHPYVMFTTDLAEIPKVKWLNYFTKEEIPTSIRINNLGFVADFDFMQTPNTAYLQEHGKQPGEKVVLLTGGSAAQGVGATSNEATIAGRMEHYLNQVQRKVRYRVINLAMPSWISYQEFIALDLFGSPFDPDWVVVMDGSNDAATACELGSGVGNPMLWPAMQYFLNGQSVYSGLSDFLLKRSALFRLLVGKEYSGPSPSKDYYLDPHESDARFRIRKEITWGDLADQLTFYLRSQTSILRLYQDAKYILSTQPIVTIAGSDLYAGIQNARTAQEQSTYKRQLADLSQSLYQQLEHRPCARTPNRPGHSYFIAQATLALEKLATSAKIRGWRDVEYTNTIPLFPLNKQEREGYFIDIIHLNDRGQDLLGRFYAKKILARDGFTNEAKAL